MKNQNFSINKYNLSRFLYPASAVMLFALLFLTIYPQVNHVQDSNALGNATVLNETSISITAGGVDMFIQPANGGSAVKSIDSDIAITTNNYTGYTLGISSTTTGTDSRDLVNVRDDSTAKIQSISSNTTLSAFQTSSALNNMWGFNIVSSGETITTYRQAPNEDGIDINSTTAANTEADTYTMSVVARVDETLPAGSYRNAFNITAVANPTPYIIRYNANEETDLESLPLNMPSDQAGEDHALISATAPTRENYEFLGWCTGESHYGSCDATVYQPGDTIILDGTAAENITELTAMWKGARAILGANGNLNFVYNTENYIANIDADNNITYVSDYEDNLGATTITAIYTVPKNATKAQLQARWAGTGISNASSARSDITSVNFDSSMSNFYPTSTAYWFGYDGYVSSVTQTRYLNTSEVTDMSYMFESTGRFASSWSLEDSTGWDVNKVTSFWAMFNDTGRGATTWEMDLSDWQIGGDLGEDEYIDMEEMFRWAGYESDSWHLTINNWDMSKVDDIYGIFMMSGHDSSTWKLEGIKDWHLDNIVDMDFVFSAAAEESTSFETDLSGWKIGANTDTEYDIDMGYMFYEAGENATTWTIGDISGWDVSRAHNMECMFELAGTKATVWNIGNLDNWNVSNVENMADMFSGAGENATTWNIGNLSTKTVTTSDDSYTAWDVSNIEKFEDMFLYAGGNVPGGIVLDLSGWTPTSATDMNYMFYGANIKTIYCENTWTTTGDSTYMFRDATNLNIGSTEAMPYDSTKTDVTYAHPGTDGYFTIKPSA